MRSGPLGLALMAAALLPLGNAARLLEERRDFLDRALPAEATVAANEEVPSESNARGVVFYPRLRFADATGTRREARSNVGAFPASHAIGDRLAIRYDVDDSSDVREDSFAGLWLEPMIFGVPAMLTLLGGFWLWRRDRKVT